MTDDRHWTRPHLLGLEELTAAEIVVILDAAESFVGDDPHSPKRGDLRGRQIANIFFEPSTRTRTSFGLAARRLGADTIDFTPGGSSVSKGEAFIDTAKNIEAMGVDVVVVRHSSPGAPHLLIAAPAGAASSMPATARTNIPRKACSTSSRFGNARAGSPG